MRFQSLTQFYNSDVWRAFRLQLMHDRAINGVIYDEWNGQPIYKTFDVVAHHKTPLTLANVNDFSISLNPDNVMLVSHKSHNEIHARFGYMTNKKVYYVYGAPCSGKTSFVESVKGNSDVVVDIDLIWQMVTGGALYFKPDALKSIVFAVRDTMLEKVKTRSGNWERAYIIEGGAIKSERERRINALGCEPIFINTPKEDCIKNLLCDNKRKQVIKEWEQYIYKWFDQYTE